uniref:helix-turn-helix domain-containing protein n=1 Tax=Pedobacter schmidteae TaxID=2201271 RepID=UPI000EB44BDB|nr:helix-turn-helix transcriptional regulator [Pedobacter schmidteae]
MQEILSKKEIGERIKELRVKSGLSQAFIANVLSLSRSNYSQIELGNQYPSFNTLHEIARYYAKSYEWLLHGHMLELSTETPAKISVLVNDLEATFKHFTVCLKKLEHEIALIKQRKYRSKT